eukprot:gnl/TRDRNA2_/TRDRNA2_184871_c0_seq1.p1 gnl/TRDRNA2_/TRDRNA2_184871_c0~~gnl/TRDRNA2_/TRDRNA2_184871_c0_seq1.p1  ORF type:complete len:424 (-),score=79.10 gnl/TRDRNA2_/TRDRNA2_184871_c0_seq1:112-1383(-)
MTVSDYFKLGIFDRRATADRIRKVRSRNQDPPSQRPEAELQEAEKLASEEPEARREEDVKTVRHDDTSVEMSGYASRPGGPRALSDSSSDEPSAAKKAEVESAPSLPPCVGSPQMSPRPPCISLVLVGDALELIMAPGDVLAVKGGGRLTEIGTAHGFMGHVLLVLSPPISVHRNSPGAKRFEAVWPESPEVTELWRVRTLESTRCELGLHEAEMVLYVERSTGYLTLVGELTRSAEGIEDLVQTEHEVVELWQSPSELRSGLRTDLMIKVLKDMKAYEASWSSVTAARAVISKALSKSQISAADHGGDESATMEAIIACWKREPICTSVVIVFWQRYLCEIANADPLHADKPLNMILKWMPVKADRGLPGELLGAMRRCGWVAMAQIPTIFRPMTIPQFVEQPEPSTTASSEHMTTGDSEPS